jgi:hypothetical protein
MIKLGELFFTIRLTDLNADLRPHAAWFAPPSTQLIDHPVSGPLDREPLFRHAILLVLAIRALSPETG